MCNELSSRDHELLFFRIVLQSDGSYIDKFGGVAWFNEEGEWHREDGPACISPSGIVEWFINGHLYSFAEWLIKSPVSDEVKMLLRLRYV
jgi:hypothetical protein